MLQHILSPLFSPPPPHSPRPSIFLLDFSGLLFFGGPVLMDFWPGPCRELPSWEPGAGLNSIPAWVLYLHNQSRPPPHRAEARRRPHPRAGRGIPKGPGRPSARGRGCTAATRWTGHHPGVAVSLGVVRAPGSSTFSPSSCFWFRPLQTNR